MAHEDLKKQYEADAQWHPKPWELWEWGIPGYKINSGCSETMNFDDEFTYRRKPDAPSRNCAMCKHWHKNTISPFCDINGKSCSSADSPDWCPLTQKEEPNLLTAARDLLQWLEGFDLMRGAEKVKALRKAVEEAEKQNQYNLC